MGRGLGKRQLAFLAALRRLDGEYGPGWHSPAAVVCALDPQPVAKVVRPNVIGMSPVEEQQARADAVQLVRLREMDAAGGISMGFAIAIANVEARIVEREAAVRRRRAAVPAPRPKAPNTARPFARASEEANPSRVLALLARRGLVEREARTGPGARVRLR